jgi:DNA-binding transcriptional regulator LsrR (DeoR family)
MLAYIAALHYQFGLSQTDIASRLGVSNMTVSRNIRRAFDQGVVQVTIREPYTFDRDAQERLAAHVPQVKFCVVKDTDIESIAGAFAYRFSVDPSMGNTIGVGIGATVAAFVDQLPPMRLDDGLIVQLIGGLPEVSYANSFSILDKMAGRVGATGIYFSTSALVSSAESRDAALDAYGDERSAPALWGSLDSAIFGIGRLARDDTHELLLNPRLVRREEAEELLHSGAVTDVLGHCLNEEGELVHTSLSERLAAIPMDTLRRVPKRIVLAGGAAKATAVAAALRSGLVTQLVTDSACAAELINELDG